MSDIKVVDVNNKGRIASLDILRGFAIILMVFDHIGFGSVCHQYIQSFHMPLFFIASGFLWKKTSIKNVAKRRFKTLIVPYIIFSVIYCLIKVIANYLYKPVDLGLMLKAVVLFPTDITNMPYNPALWFLPCMFLTSLLYEIISNVFKKHGKIISICLIALGGVIYSSLTETMLPFTIEPLCTALFFMLVGETIRKYWGRLEKVFDKWHWCILLLAIQIVLVMVNPCVDMRSARYCIVPLFLINGIIGTMAYWVIIKKLLQIEKLAVIKKLSYFSKKAMPIIVLHQFVLLNLSHIIPSFNSTLRGLVIFVLVMIIVILIQFVCSKLHIEFIFGYQRSQHAKRT